MSKIPLFLLARLSRDVGFTCPVLHGMPTAPGLLNFPVSSSQRLLLKPLLLL